MRVTKLPWQDGLSSIMDEWGGTERGCTRCYPITREVIEQAALAFSPGDRVEIPGGEICIVQKVKGTEVFVTKYPRLGMNPFELTKVE
jgi:hypothetical protein